MIKNKPDKSNWDDFRGKFFKPEFFSGDTCVTICTGIDTEYVDDEPTMTAEIEFEGCKYLVQLNKTNRDKLKEIGIPSPEALIGKKIVWKEVLARNPALKKDVPSLRIVSLED